MAARPGSDHHGIVVTEGVVRIAAAYLTHGFTTANVINFFWLSYNLIILTIAILFASERPKFRQAERFPIKAAVKVHDGEKTWLAYSQDISETGLSLLFSEPVYLEPDKPVTLKGSDRDYFAEFQAVIVHVERLASSRYKYAFQITAYDESNYRSLLHILYDRKPMLPERHSGKLWSNLIGRNIRQRQRKFFPTNRKLPRIPINRRLIAYVEKFVQVLDFNYRYVTIRSAKSYQQIDLVLDSTQRIRLNCRFVKTMTERSSQEDVHLYEVLNYREVAVHSLRWLESERRRGFGWPRAPKPPAVGVNPAQQLSERSTLVS
ncbi:MAG: PilZ domain-containing protein [Desulfitobacteriaceae bacterium]